MFYPLIPVILFVIIIVSCKGEIENNNTCNVSDPIEDLPWLRERIGLIISGNQQLARYQYISMAEYRGETVFMFGNCDPLAISIFPIFNCKNERIGALGEIPADSLFNREIIWKTEDSACNF